MTLPVEVNVSGVVPVQTYFWKTRIDFKYINAAGKVSTNDGAADFLLKPGAYHVDTKTAFNLSYMC